VLLPYAVKGGGGGGGIDGGIGADDSKLMSLPEKDALLTELGF